MLDEMDDGARVGVWSALGVVALVLFGLLGGIVIKHGNDKGARKAGAGMGQTALAAGIHRSDDGAGKVPMLAAGAIGAMSAAAGTDTLVDVPLVGDLAGTIFFGTGQAGVPTDAANSLATIKAAADAAPKRRLVLSGFHDATGDPAKNADLAKERAKAVREALKTLGLPADRVVLRKPASTTGEGSDQEARRVEARLVQ